MGAADARAHGFDGAAHWSGFSQIAMHHFPDQTQELALAMAVWLATVAFALYAACQI
jgi:hypothetical protein